jgi:hypothetical protein
VKIAFVVGFYDPVKTALNARYPETSYGDRLIWIASGKRSLIAFKQRFYDVVQTAESLLVCLGRANTQRYLEDDTRGVIGVANAQYATPVELRAFGNLYDPLPIVALVESFGIETEATMGVDRVRSKVHEGKILCVSLEGKTSVLVALQRAGVSTQALNECFVEEIIEGGRNSNLMQHLKQRGHYHSCLLYAWGGLRTSTPEVKAAYKFDCHEAQSASQVAEMFKKWIIEGK